MARIKIKILKDLLNFKAGRIIQVDPNDMYWARRISDSKYDKCLEVLSKSKKPKEEPKQVKEKKEDKQDLEKEFTKKKFTKRGNK